MVDLHILECVDKPEVHLNRIGGETQVACLKGLKLMELGKDVNHGAHRVELYFESDERMEGCHKLGLHEMIQHTA